MRPIVIFAPGAGAPSSSDWMRAWGARLGALGDVVTLDYPYMLAKKRRPDPLPVLIEAHRAAVLAALGTSGRPLVLAGKSMGSRIGCHVAAAKDELAPRPAALICFGYPLVGQNGKIRDQVLLALETPILFVQGTRDALCPLERLEAVRPRMQARNELFVVEGGDHSLAVTKKRLGADGETQDDVDRRILAAVEAFTRSTL